MLALRTGWTERTIGEEISDDFRRACHHALFAERLASPLSYWRGERTRLEGIDLTRVPTEERSRLRYDRIQAVVNVGYLEAALGLADRPAEPA